MCTYLTCACKRKSILIPCPTGKDCLLQQQKSIIIRYVLKRKFLNVFSVVKKAFINIHILDRGPPPTGMEKKHTHFKIPQLRRPCHLILFECLLWSFMFMRKLTAVRHIKCNLTQLLSLVLYYYYSTCKYSGIEYWKIEM